MTSRDDKRGLLKGADTPQGPYRTNEPEEGEDVMVLDAGGEALSADEIVRLLNAYAASQAVAPQCGSSGDAHGKAAAAIASLKGQLAEILGDDESLWPACILGTDEAQALVDAFSPPPPTTNPSVERAELENIANAKRFDREVFRDDTEFADWAQSRCRHKLASVQNDTAKPPDSAVLAKARRWAALTFNPHDCPPGSKTVNEDCIAFAKALVAQSETPAMDSLKAFAARCRPAVKGDLMKSEQLLLKGKDGTFAPHYLKSLEHNADRARRLLDEIDALIGSANWPDEPPIPPHHIPVA